jgi:hypothetical protein
MAIVRSSWQRQEISLILLTSPCSLLCDADAAAATLISPHEELKNDDEKMLLMKFFARQRELRLKSTCGGDG